MSKMIIFLAFSTFSIFFYQVSLFHHVSGVPHRRKGISEQCPVVSVEVPACKRAAVVTHHDTIWVQHWDHLQHQRGANKN